MPVPFIDLKRDTGALLPTFLQITERVFRSGIFCLGPETEAFESAFASYLNVRHVFTVGNGTLALYAACVALGIGPEDEVIVPANTFIATAEAVLMVGARPVFCDIDQQTHHFDFQVLETLVTPCVKAVIPVHLYGRVIQMDQILSLAREKHLFIIEDACQAHGAEYQGKKAGTFGDIGCFSFYPTKNLGALGEGGALVTNDDVLAERVRGIRAHGSLKDKYYHEIFGSNLRMEALQAGFLNEKLKILDVQNARRREIANKYRKAFLDLPIQCPPDVWAEHVYHLFVITTEKRDALQTFLQQKGIGTGVHYPIPLSKQPVYQLYHASCPKAEKVANQILSLPLFPAMREEEIQEVISGVRAFFV